MWAPMLSSTLGHLPMAVGVYMFRETSHYFSSSWSKKTLLAMSVFGESSSASLFSTSWASSGLFWEALFLIAGPCNPFFI